MLIIALGDVLLLLAMINYLMAADSVGRMGAEWLVEMVGIPLVLLTAALFLQGKLAAPGSRARGGWRLGQEMFVAVCVISYGVIKLVRR